jgi:hypothetical protein
LAERLDLHGGVKADWSAGYSNIALRTKSYVRFEKGKTLEPLVGSVRALEGISARVASSQVSLVASAQNTNGLAASRKRPKISKEGTACKLIEISSLSPAGERR